MSEKKKLGYTHHVILLKQVVDKVSEALQRRTPMDIVTAQGQFMVSVINLAESSSDI